MGAGTGEWATEPMRLILKLILGALNMRKRPFAYNNLAVTSSPHSFDADLFKSADRTLGGHSLTSSSSTMISAIGRMIARSVLS
jgi:hypothetical protein